MSGTTGQPNGNPFENASTALNQAGSVYQEVAAPGALRMSMNQFINPYQDQVIDQTIGRINDQRNADISQIGGAAARSGAFGGSRHGLLESTVYDNANRNVGEMTNTMLSQGFDTAAGLGQQDITNRMAGAQGGQSLASQFYGIGTDTLDRQAATGLQQQQLAQNIISQGNSQYDQYLAQPQKSLNGMLSAISGSPLAGNQTQSYTPGMLDYLSLGAQTVSAGKGGGGK